MTSKTKKKIETKTEQEPTLNEFEVKIVGSTKNVLKVYIVMLHSHYPHRNRICYGLSFPFIPKKRSKFSIESNYKSKAYEKVI